MIIRYFNSMNDFTCCVNGTLVTKCIRDLGKRVVKKDIEKY